MEGTNYNTLLKLFVFFQTPNENLRSGITLQTVNKKSKWRYKGLDYL